MKTKALQSVRRAAATGAFAMLLAAAFAQSNIDPAKPHAWGENVGWINMNSGDGVKSAVAFPPAGIDDWMLMH